MPMMLLALCERSRTGSSLRIDRGIGGVYGRDGEEVRRPVDLPFRTTEAVVAGRHLICTRPTVTGIPLIENGVDVGASDVEPA